MIGQVVGNHRIVAEISHGGMGVVYRAEHAVLGRPAAVKVLLPQFSHDREVVIRFFNEAKAASSIRHPNIIEIFDFGHLPDGQAFIVMEFVPGETLSRRLAQRPMSELEVVELGRQVGSALQAAHERGVVHRDLKPDNIMLVADAERPGGWRSKLVDFGIAKLADPGIGASHTRTGALLGTPSYMSPEQCRGAGAVDHRTDLYSLGCILYEAIVGRPPFLADGPGELIAAHLFQAPVPLGHAAAVSPELDALVMRLLGKRPDDRPPTAAAVLAELERVPIGRPSVPLGVYVPQQPTVLAGPPTTLGGASGQSQIHTAPVAPRKRGWMVAAGAVLLAGGIAAGIALTGGSSTKTASTPSAPAPAAQPAPTVTAGPVPMAPTPTPAPGAGSGSGSVTGSDSGSGSGSGSGSDSGSGSGSGSDSGSVTGSDSGSGSGSGSVTGSDSGSGSGSGSVTGSGSGSVTGSDPGSASRPSRPPHSSRPSKPKPAKPTHTPKPTGPVVDPDDL